MQFILITVLFLLGLFFIVKGGDLLIDACFLLSKITGISKIVIGATLVSLATALPEITVSLIAIHNNLPHMAIGNAIGSMICNICLVLGAGIFLAPQKVKMKDFQNKAVLLVFLNMLLFLLCINFKIDLLESALLIIICTLFFYHNIKEANASLKEHKNKQKKESIKKYKIILLLLQFLISCGIIFLGSKLIVQNGERLAKLLKIKEEVIGFTLIATSTCLPELITTLIAVKKKSLDLALGNIVGSNIINITLLFGLGGVLSGGGGLDVSKYALFVLMPFLFMITLLLLLPIFKTQKTYRMQGFVLLIIYLIYTIFILSTLIFHSSA